MKGYPQSRLSVGDAQRSLRSCLPALISVLVFLGAAGALPIDSPGATSRSRSAFRYARPARQATLATFAGTPHAHTRALNITRSGRRPCGSMPINYRPTPSEHYTRMYISATRSVSCGKARRLMRRYWDGDGKGALHCSGSSVVCEYPDGWTCDSVTPGQWPVVEECLRRHTLVVGKVRSRIKGPR